MALIDRNDRNHARCVEALTQLAESSLATTWPCMAEAMYLLGRDGGLPPQRTLWTYVDNDIVTIDTPAPMEWSRIRDLMIQYADSPMDMADASLVAAAERRNVRRVFTLDRHFYSYRVFGQHAFEIYP